MGSSNTLLQVPGLAMHRSFPQKILYASYNKKIGINIGLRSDWRASFHGTIQYTTSLQFVATSWKMIKEK
jgi:hypothetical protein